MNPRLVFIFLIAILVLISMAACGVSVWSECRQQHSWLFCMQVLSK